MADPASAFLIGGTLVSAAGAVYSGIQGANAAEKDAALKKEQALQVEASGYRDDILMKRQEDRALGQLSSAYAKSGTSLQGSGLLDMEDLAFQYEEQRASYAKSIAFKADQLRKGADISYDVAADREAAGYISGFGTILTGAGKYYQNRDPNLSDRVTLGQMGTGAFIDPNAPSTSYNGRGK